ncbi:hypothetical protein BD289DRAFT_336307, partial [Coniella lustricola]
PPPPPREFPASVAVIMETNPATVANLVPIMLHFANVLGPEWPVVLLTLRANWVEPPSPAFRRMMAARRIHIYFLPDDTAFPDHTSVSKFLTRAWFWERFESADRVLLFQADSVLCARSERRVDDFAEYDLIGAPINPQYGIGFNGGLSLRNPKAMLDIIRDPASNSESEHKHDKRDSSTPPPPQPPPPPPAVRLPTIEVAKQFAVETIWNNQPLGYHQPFRWLTPTQKIAAINWCPE